MWRRKIGSWVFASVLVGYIAALWALVLHYWITDPPINSSERAAVERGHEHTSHWISVNTNYVVISDDGTNMVTMVSNRIFLTNVWRHITVTVPKVNDNDLRHAVSLDDYLLRSRKGND